jgi:hypothetical protein
MSTTDPLISKWEAQIANLQAEAERTAPGAELDSILHRIALCQRAIESMDRLVPPALYPTSPKEPSPLPAFEPRS